MVTITDLSSLHVAKYAFVSVGLSANVVGTHAILLSSMVPYSQVSTNDQISIINNYLNNLSQDSVMNDNPFIDESCFRYVIKNYLKYWHEKLLSGSIKFSSFHPFVRSCFSFFSYQFMQIKNTPNILFLNTT